MQMHVVVCDVCSFRRRQNTSCSLVPWQIFSHSSISASTSSRNSSVHILTSSGDTWHGSPRSGITRLTAIITRNLGQSLTCGRPAVARMGRQFMGLKFERQYVSTVCLSTCLVFIIVSFSCICISQGSVVTLLMCGGIFNNHFIASCLHYALVKELWKSVDFWWRYGQK